MSKPDPARHAPHEVDAYLQALPENDRAALEQLRLLIHQIAPDCTERVSYGIPMFRVGRDFVGISSQKAHCALHSASPGLIERMGDELKGIRVSGATLHFDPNQPLPIDLITKILRARLDEITGSAD